MRNRNLIAGLVLALALVFSLVAAAQTSSSPSPAQGQATSPSQSAPSAPPSSEPSASPQTPADSQSQAAPQGQTGATSQPSQAQPGSATSGGQSQAAGHGTSVEEELQLTEDQKAKLQPILQDEMIQLDAVRTDNSLSPEQKQAKALQIKKDHFSKIEAILTPEQRKKLADLQQKAQQQRQGTGNPSSPQQPPR